MYGITNSGNLSDDELTEGLIEAGFIQYQCQMSIYYNYAPDGTKIIILSYIDYFVYWYTSEALVKCFVDTLGKRLHVKFLGYTHWFMSIRISHIKDHSITVDQDIYATFIVSKYLYTDTVNTSTKFYKTSLPYDMIFTIADASTNDEQVEKLTREFIIHYRDCIGSLIYLLYTRVDLSFSVHNL